MVESGPAAPGVPEQASPPQFALSARTPAHLDGVDVLAYAVALGDDAPVVAVEADEIAEAAGLDLLKVLAHAGHSGAAGEIASFPLARDGAVVEVLLVGVGAQTPHDVRRAAAALARACAGRAGVATDIVASGSEALEPFVVGAVLGSFRFTWRDDAHRESPPGRPAERITLCGLPDADRLGPDLARAIAVAGAGWRARTLATVPSNVKNPEWLAAQARDLAARAGLEVTVLDEQQLADQGFGGICAVGRASATPPRLLRLDYAPARANRRTPRVVLVGKGITFDTGGLSIKPADGMVTMKRDMTGGGVVLAVMGALAAVGCPIRVTGLIAAAENAVGADALRPGDVITHWGGRTSEVTNTDAEGRLVLADGLAYAASELKPAALVDIATLTGAMRVALGQGTGGLFTGDHALARALADAGAAAGEPVWRMPLVADYEDKLSSKVADADNAPGGPGAITAALFLRPFAGGVPWAHLDIASVGDAPADRYEWSAGPTGFGARLLLAWLGSPQPLAGIG